MSNLSYVGSFEIYQQAKCQKSFCSHVIVQIGNRTQQIECSAWTTKFRECLKKLCQWKTLKLAYLQNCVVNFIQILHNDKAVPSTLRGHGPAMCVTNPRWRVRDGVSQDRRTQQSDAYLYRYTVLSVFTMAETISSRRRA